MAQKRAVVIDWYMTLELENGVPPSHIKALEKVMEHFEVHICSYVGSWKRWNEVKGRLDKLEKTLGKEVTRRLSWESTGENGKASYATDINAEFIVDDSWHVVKEARGRCSCVFAVQTPTCDHWRFQGQKGVKVVKDFVEAAELILGNV